LLDRIESGVWVTLYPHKNVYSDPLILSGMATQTGKFDLNIEEVLEAWDLADATREILANALNEQALTGGSDSEVFQDKEGH
jgi:hypothetical protein